MHVEPRIVKTQDQTRCFRPPSLRKQGSMSLTEIFGRNDLIYVAQ